MTFRMLVRRIVAGDGDRATRVHTESGNRLNWLGIPAMAAAVSRRVLGSDDGPWMTPGSVQKLETELRTTDIMLELGGGNSTTWYAARVSEIHTVESDPNWAAKIEQSAANKSLSNVHVHRAQFGETLDTFRNSNVDVVIVDFTESPEFRRPDAVKAALDWPVPPRIIVLDDSDRPQYRKALENHDVLQVCRYPGIRPRPLVATETTLLYPRQPTPASLSVSPISQSH